MDHPPPLVSHQWLYVIIIVSRAGSFLLCFLFALRVDDQPRAPVPVLCNTSVSHRASDVTIVTVDREPQGVRNAAGQSLLCGISCCCESSTVVNMSSPSLTALVVLVASAPMAITTAFVVPTVGTFLSSVSGIEQQKQARPMPRRLGMAVDDCMNKEGGAESSSRIGFLRKQGALGVAAISTLGLSSPVSAAGLFDVGQNDKIELEEAPSRIIIGKTQSIKWSTVATSIAALRTEARERFHTTGAKSGREVTSFSNVAPDGVDITVGLEVADAKDSPALGDGFAATVVAPRGLYLRDDHAAGPGMVPWMTFTARIPKEGYEMSDPSSMFEVYSGAGGKESVSMYMPVKKASE